MSAIAAARRDLASARRQAQAAEARERELLVSACTAGLVRASETVGRRRMEALAAEGYRDTLRAEMRDQLQPHKGDPAVAHALADLAASALTVQTPAEALLLAYDAWLAALQTAVRAGVPSYREFHPVLGMDAQTVANILRNNERMGEGVLIGRREQVRTLRDQLTRNTRAMVAQ